MQRLEVSCAVRHIYLYIYDIYHKQKTKQKTKRKYKEQGPHITKPATNGAHCNIALTKPFLHLPAEGVI